MTLVIASDIHGSAPWTRRLLDACEAEQASQLLLLGDLLYHGPRNPLPEGYDPKHVAALLNGMAPRIIAVQGNCDAQVDSMLLDFPIVESATVFLDGHRFFCSHGHLLGPGSPPPMAPGDVLLSGHTHLYGIGEKDGRLFMNPGSVSLPKEGRAHTYLVYRDHACSIKDFDGRTLITTLLTSSGDPATK
jgi:putative phosphoesterase